MDGVVYKKFGNTREICDGVFPLFGFACADYMAVYNADPETMADCYIFGAIIQDVDINTNVDLFRFIKTLMKHDKNLAMIVLDIDGISDDNLDTIKEELDGTFGFDELKDVYEDRIVFARRV